MIYKKFKDLDISALGFGAMRLPIIDGDMSKIDEPLFGSMLEYAMEHGVNYYDTAYNYHGEQSEIVLSRMLKSYPRDSYFFATKFPGFDTRNMPKGREIFERQIEKCQLDYFDFYLFHDVNNSNIDAYLDDSENGLFSYIKEQKKNGRIRHLGFSVHGDYDVPKRFLEAYGDDIEFCQLQLNWVDYEFQEARRKIELLNEYGIPIWVMEPLRGGRLASLPDKYVEELGAICPGRSLPEWGFRFIQTIPNVVVTLSGMSDFEQVRQNIDIFATEEPLSDAEWDGLLAVADDMKDDMTVPCTGCKYCMSSCPKELDIPNMMSIYNDNALTGRKMSIGLWVFGPGSADKLPSACIGCRSCEAICPQEIEISEVMKKLAAAIV